MIFNLLKFILFISICIMIAKKQDLSDYFQCQYCHQTFDQNQKCPRIVKCGHTYCESCIKKIIKTDKQFKCHICDQNLGKLRLGLAYKNYSLLRLMSLNNIESQKNLEYIIQKSKFTQIVIELDRIPKNLKKLIIKRTFDTEKKSPWQYDTVRINRHLMRLFTILPLFQNLQHFQLWVKFSYIGFQQVLAESLRQLKKLKYVKLVTPYDIESRIHNTIFLTGNETIKFDIRVEPW